MATARIADYFMDDGIISVSASSTTIITRGDWVAYSALWGVGATDAHIGSPAYKVSAAGVALQHNPKYDDQGVALNQSSLQVATRGVFRFSGAVSGTAATVPMGAHAYPDTTSSGIVGATGATGIGPLWNTAPPQGISANPTGAIASGVGIVVGQPAAGDITALALDIRINLATNVGYF
jgi:hypothetical protein